MRSKIPNQKLGKLKKIETGPSTFEIRRKGNKIRTIRIMKVRKEEKDNVRIKV